MAIDRMKKVWLVCPTAQADTVPETLAEFGLVHVAEIQPQGDQGARAISRLDTDTRDIEATLRALNETLEVLNEFSEGEGDFLSNLIPTPTETTRSELLAALDAIDVDDLHGKVKDASARRASAEAAIAQANERLAALGPFGGLPIQVVSERDLRWTEATLWLAPAKQASRVLELGLGPEAAILESMSTLDNKTLVAAACLREDAEHVATRMRNLGFEHVRPEAESTTLEKYVQGIEAERRQNEQTLDAALDELRELGKRRRQVELVLGHWEETLETQRSVTKMAATGRAAVLLGYVRERDVPDFQKAVEEKLPQVSAVLEDPNAEDEVPVSLRCSNVVRPASFLVEMFGLPHYFQFDPSGFLMLSFVLFFGICLGDAIYGVVLFAMSYALIRRYRNYPGIRSLFELLAWCAVSSFLIGVLTGTWAADLLTKYIGKDNIIGEIVGGQLLALDPLGKPLVALGIALFLGVANQFWGVCMKMYQGWRQGDRAAALFDGGLWLILLPGLVLLIAAFFSPDLPPWVSQVGMWLALVGGVGLVLTQGRNEKTLLGKIVVGLVSLYGIVGSYGAVAFIGDTLSYSRLLALGLTTAIVGTAVNIIAGMLYVDVALVGVLLFALVAIPGHFFNLLISGLGAFIHSARLIFVEFFGRFYEPGAQRFAPLGASGSRIRVMD
jgi:V/A-type H+-transporting ATPase subunit I